MPKEVSFSAKLAAFMLNSLDHEVRCRKQGGFDSSSKEVLGLLPFLHSNVTKKEFKDIMLSSDKSMKSSMKKVCKEKKLDKSLVAVGFKCEAQSDMAVGILVSRFVDTIEFAYKTRKNGIERAREMATFMKWQHKHGIIPKESVEWCKEISAKRGLEPA